MRREPRHWVFQEDYMMRKQPHWRTHARRTTALDFSGRLSQKRKVSRFWHSETSRTLSTVAFLSEPIKNTQGFFYILEESLRF